MLSFPNLCTFSAEVFSYSSCYSQIGGRNSFEFVDMGVNAHVAGVGGLNVSIKDNDLNMILQNPALLTSEMHKNLSLNYVAFFADIKSTSLAYAQNFNNRSIYAGGLQYNYYGQIQRTDPTGADLGTFSPNEYFIFASRSHTINYYSIGATVKFASSSIDTYNSLALMADLGGIFKHPKKDFTIGLVFKNMGVALKKYTPESKVALPFDIQLGTTFKPEHMPLRMSITVHHLYKWDIVYLDPTVKGTVDLEGNEIKQKKSFADKLGRHFVLGGELILSKNFHLRFGYNYLRRRELRLQTKSGGAGFSFGFMMRVKSFEFSFSRAYYHVAGGANYLTVTTNFSKLLKKKQKVNSN
ncbi:MAG: type IX secretion system protein PorQ [Cytophagaceae bacterium]|nr:type IX secretion system protein PorQ [Cytophagaceae bacterium]